MKPALPAAPNYSSGSRTGRSRPFGSRHQELTFEFKDASPQPGGGGAVVEARPDAWDHGSVSTFPPVMSMVAALGRACFGPAPGLLRGCRLGAMRGSGRSPPRRPITGARPLDREIKDEVLHEQPWRPSPPRGLLGCQETAARRNRGSGTKGPSRPRAFVESVPPNSFVLPDRLGRVSCWTCVAVLSDRPPCEVNGPLSEQVMILRLAPRRWLFHVKRNGPDLVAIADHSSRPARSFT